MQIEKNGGPSSVETPLFKTLYDLRTGGKTVQYSCSSCQNAGIFDLRKKLLCNDLSVSIFDQMTCENCSNGKLVCAFIDELPQEKPKTVKKSEYESDPQTRQWQIQDYDLIGKLAKRVFSTSELAQLSRLDTTHLFYAIENLIKKKNITDISDDEATKMKDNVLWLRDFNKNYPDQNNN